MKAKKKHTPRRAPKKKVKRPPVKVELHDGWRQGETLTISETREQAAALAERLKRRFAALMEDPPKKGGRR